MTIEWLQKAKLTQVLPTLAKVVRPSDLASVSEQNGEPKRTVDVSAVLYNKLKFWETETYRHSRFQQRCWTDGAWSSKQRCDTCQVSHILRKIYLKDDVVWIHVEWSLNSSNLCLTHHQVTSNKTAGTLSTVKSRALDTLENLVKMTTIRCLNTSSQTGWDGVSRSNRTSSNEADITGIQPLLQEGTVPGSCQFLQTQECLTFLRSAQKLFTLD